MNTANDSKVTQCTQCSSTKHKIIYEITMSTEFTLGWKYAADE